MPKWAAEPGELTIAQQPHSEHKPTGTGQNKDQPDAVEVSREVVYSGSDQDFRNDEDGIR